MNDRLWIATITHDNPDKMKQDFMYW